MGVEAAMLGKVVEVSVGFQRRHEKGEAGVSGHGMAYILHFPK